MKPALIIGSTCVDVIINLPHLPVSQEDVHPTAQSMTLGGCAYNVAYIVRLLDAPYTHISPVGTGMYGDYVAKLMTEAGLPIHVRVKERDNGCCYCLVEESGERTFMAWHGAEYTFDKTWMEPFRAEDFGICYICGIEVEEPTGDQILEYLEEHPQLPVFFAPGPRLMHIPQEKLDRILALKPILHLNEAEASHLSGEDCYDKAARTLYSITHAPVIVTLGTKGTCFIDYDGSESLLPSVPAEHVIDTIGAGDSHAGTIIASLTKGWSLRRAIAYANQVAAAVVSVKGIDLPKDQVPEFAELSD